LPTANRPLILASYPVEQELSRDGGFIGQPQYFPTEIPTLTPLSDPFAGLDVQVIEMSTLPGQLTTRLLLYNGSAASMRFTPDDLWLALGYAERPAGLRVPAEGMASFELLPKQAADVTLVWVWDGELFRVLGVGGWVFGLEL